MQKLPNKTTLTAKLALLPLNLKIALLICGAIIIFAANFLPKIIPLHIYFLLFSIFTLALSYASFRILERRTFRYLIKMWSCGSLIYLLIAIPRIYWGKMLTPYFVFTTIIDRWLYSLILPLMILATLNLGLVFMQTTSPVDFLRWRKSGAKIALLFRVLQHAEQAFYNTKMALIMQNKWAEERDAVSIAKSLRCVTLKLRYAPLLIATTLRNIILHWLPWGWICFSQLQNKLTKKREELYVASKSTNTNATEATNTK